MRRRSRGLSDEDRALWNRVAETTDPLKKPTAKRMDPAQVFTQGKPAPKTPGPLKPFRVGQSTSPSKSTTATLAPSIVEQLNGAAVQMDKRAYGKLKRGKLKPDAKIDLHGLTLTQAHPRLIGFVGQSYAKGHRLILVITGKGKSKPEPGPIPARVGVLRHQVPQWLTMPPLAQMVLQVAPAHLRHGGEGAYYVYLRRAR